MVMSSQCIFLCLFLILAYAPFAYASSSAVPKPEEIISFDRTEKTADHQDKQVIWKLKPSLDGLDSTIALNLAKPKQVAEFQGTLGGESKIQIDGMIMKQDFFTETDATIKHLLSFTTLTDGDHVITLTVRDFEGKLHTQTKNFTLNARPKITVTQQEKEEEFFNPSLTFSFFGEQDSYAGMVDMYLDERPFRSFNVKPDQNHKAIELSKLTGDRICKADMSPGTHVLTITAHGNNGSFSTQTLPINVKAQQPVVSVRHTNDKKIEKIDITYPASSNKIVGTAEIRLNHSIILEERTDKTSLSISRTDLLAALEKHNLSKEPASMIISTRTANQVELWQEMLFK